MRSFNTWNLIFMLIFGTACLCQPTTLRQKLINLQASVVRISETLNNTVTDFREKLIQLTDTVNQNLIQITDTLNEVVTGTSCPDNFTRYERSCYYFSEDLPHGGDRGYARAMCHMMGSNLIAIDSKQEAEFIQSHTSSARYWTSAHRHVGYWIWESTGLNLTDGYPPWHSDHSLPSNVDCAYINGSTGKLYAHYPCSQPGMRYICETKIPLCI